MELFDTFNAPDQAAWIAQIRKELRDLPLEQAGMTLEPGIVAQPFLHPALQDTHAVPLWSESIAWTICEDIDCMSTPSANAQIQQALALGCTALRLSNPTLEQLPELLETVYLQMVELRIAGDVARDAAIFEVLASVLSQKGLSASAVNVFLENDFGNWQDTEAKLQFLDIAALYPTFQSVGIMVPSDQTYSESLATAIKQVDALFALLMETRSQDQLMAVKVHFDLSIRQNYFAEIACLRAFYVIWYNLQQRWQLNLRQPNIHVRYHEKAYTEPFYTNMIRATTMAMSAVVGGCSSLTVRPFDSGYENAQPYGQEFARRIARNVQHLLQLESGIHLLADPSAGSFYVEDLTRQIAQKAWAAFEQA
jgi:methylmalonyl-CoA mutase